MPRLILPASLRARVALALALLSTLATAGLGLLFFLQTTALDQRLLEETLSQELDYLTGLPAEAIASHTTGSMRAYRLPDDRAPSVLQGLDDGLHQLQVEGIGYYAEIRKSNGSRYALLLRDKQFVERQQRLLRELIIGSLLTAVVAAAIGFLLAGQISRPITALAARVRARTASAGGSQPGEQEPVNEVRTLIDAFEAYQQRIDQLLQRERAFTGDVSHELRTPLTVIDGAVELLLADVELTQRQRGRVERIERASRDMRWLTQALLAMARDMPMPNEAANADLAELFERVLEGLRPLLRQRGLGLVTDIRRPISRPGNPALAYVVFSNLLRNAITHTDSGKIRVQLDSERFVISDCGGGMSREQIYRLEAGAALPAPGGGRGLSLVRRVCDAAGWSLRVSSEPATGTEIYLQFG